MRKNTLVVIDDEKGIRLLLKEIFERSGFKVFVYGDPEQAKKEMNETKPDAILIDYWIPGARGDQIAFQLKEAGWELPMILMTGMSKSEVIQKVDTSAITSIIEKPFNIREVVDFVNEHMTSDTKNLS